MNMKQKKIDIIIILIITAITTIVNLASVMITIKSLIDSYNSDGKRIIIISIVIPIILIVIGVAYILVKKIYKSFKQQWIDTEELDEKGKETALKNILELTIYKLNLEEVLFKPINNELQEIEERRIKSKDKKNAILFLYKKATYLNGIMLRIDKYEDAVKFGDILIKIGNKTDALYNNSLFNKKTDFKGRFESQAMIDQAWNYIKYYRKVKDREALDKAKELLNSVNLSNMTANYCNKFYRHFYILSQYLQDMDNIKIYKDKMYKLCDELDAKRHRNYFFQDLFSRFVSPEVQYFILGSDENLNENQERQSTKIRIYYDRLYKECRAGYLNALLNMEIDNIVNQNNELIMEAFDESEKQCKELEDLYRELKDGRIAKVYCNRGRLYTYAATKINDLNDKKKYFELANAQFKKSIEMAQKNMRIDLVMRAQYYRALLFHNIDNDKTVDWGELINEKNMVYGDALLSAETTNSLSEFDDIRKWTSSKSITLIMDGKDETLDKEKTYIKFQLDRIKEYYNNIKTHNTLSKIYILYYNDKSPVLQQVNNEFKKSVEENLEVEVEVIKDDSIEGFNMGILESGKLNDMSKNLSSYHFWRSGRISFSEFNVENEEDHEVFKNRLDCVLTNNKYVDSNLIIICTYSIFLYYYYKLQNIDINDTHYKKINLETANMATFTIIPDYKKNVFEPCATDNMLI